MLYLPRRKIQLFSSKVGQPAPHLWLHFELTTRNDSRGIGTIDTAWFWSVQQSHSILKNRAKITLIFLILELPCTASKSKNLCFSTQVSLERSLIYPHHSLAHVVSVSELPNRPSARSPLLSPLCQCYYVRRKCVVQLLG